MYACAVRACVRASVSVSHAKKRSRVRHLKDSGDNIVLLLLCLFSKRVILVDSTIDFSQQHFFHHHSSSSSSSRPTLGLITQTVAAIKRSSLHIQQLNSNQTGISITLNFARYRWKFWERAANLLSASPQFRSCRFTRVLIITLRKKRMKTNK